MGERYEVCMRREEGTGAIRYYVVNRETGTVALVPDGWRADSYRSARAAVEAAAKLNGDCNDD